MGQGYEEPREYDIHDGDPSTFLLVDVLKVGYLEEERRIEIFHGYAIPFLSSRPYQYISNLEDHIGDQDRIGYHARHQEEDSILHGNHLVELDEGSHHAYRYDVTHKPRLVEIRVREHDDEGYPH